MASTMTNAGMMGEEGRTTRAIETRTSRAPSVVYLGAAFGAIAASAAIMFTAGSNRGPRFLRRQGLANFIGQWAPTILIMGLYNKVVKLERELIGLP